MKNKRIDLIALAKQAMIERGFEPSFSLETEHVIRYLSTQPEPTFFSSDARDLRDLPWSSIDNLDSQDLDQIEVVIPDKGEKVRLLIGIADVNTLVTLDSVFDLHAAVNTTSVYTGVTIFPMLPEFLSYNRTSLLPNATRQAVVVDMLLDNSGQVLEYDIYPALVQNKAKLVYEEVGLFLERGTDPHLISEDSEIIKQIRIQDHYAQLLRKRRYEQGALELETIEARAISKEGVIIDLEVPRKNRARELIEDLMIAANTTVAHFLKQHRLPCIRRVVKEPKRWDRIVQLANLHGYALPEQPDSKSLSEFMILQRKRDPDTFPDLSLSVVKLLGAGEYVLEDGLHTETSGHFGLAVSDYTHSTAPNRRYPDLVTQRLIKSSFDGVPVGYTTEKLEAIANQCTQQTNAAQKVERFMRKAEAAVFLQNRIGDVFDAIVTGSSDKGTYVRLFHPPAEGRVVEREKGLDVGDKVQVKLVRVSPLEGFIDFVPVKR